MTICAQCRDAVDRELRSTRAAIDILNQHIEHLESRNASVLAALNDGRMGDIRRILKTGSDKPVIALTSVIARNGAR